MVYLKYFSIAAVLFFSTAVYSQACDNGGKPPPLNTGTEFIVCYMQNASLSLDQTPTAFTDLFLGTLEDSAQITVTCKAIPAYHFSITLPPHSSTTHRITKDPAVNFPAQDPWIETDEKIDNTIFCVTSTTPIFCYGMNEKQFTADAFLAFPQNVATTEYRVMSYYSSNLLGEQHPSEFCVASFEDNDTVFIIPSATTANLTQAGDTEMFVLGACQCVQIQALLDPDNSSQRARRDLTGSMVISKKPVVVYGGNSRTEVPAGFVTDLSGLTTTDHLAEAIPPLADWGKIFIAKNFGRKPGDILRVLAASNNTIVKINGNIWGAPLAANAFRDTMIRQSDTMTNNIFTVEASSPILVGMIAHTAPSDNDPTGDPFLAIVPPLNQLHNDYTYFISSDNVDYDPNKQFLMITAEQGSIGNLTIGGVPVTAPFTMLPPLGGSTYGIATIPQMGGPHRILGPSTSGFTILGFGFGDKISYGYAAGMKFIPQFGIISIDPPNPGVGPGASSRTAEIIVRNIINEPIYFDSAKISYTSNTGNNLVRLSKDIAMETRSLEMAEQKKLELVAANPVENIVTGNVRIWYHSSLWDTMDPMDFPFSFIPASSTASVSGIMPNEAILENYPNPVSGNMTVHFATAAPAYAILKIYDALGRVIRVVFQGITTDKTIQISTQDMPMGEYTLELASPEFGILKHTHFIVVK